MLLVKVNGNFSRSLCTKIVEEFGDVCRKIKRSTDFRVKRNEDFRSS